ncbi:MAG: HAMP domain-containing sensor histidine kinase [Spirochaetales bacterium]
MSSWLSITGRLYLGFLVLLILALGILGTVSAFWFSSQQSASLDQFLEAEARGVADRLEVFSNPAEREQVLAGLVEQRLNRPRPYKTTLLLLDQNHNVLLQSNKALDLARRLPGLRAGESVLEDVMDSGSPYRVISATYSLGGGQVGMFRIACLLSSLDAALLSFFSSLAVVLGGSFLLLSVLALGLLRLTLGPVNAMALAAGSISEKDLGARLPVPPGRDELARLATTFNSLLARLEADYAFQERLVSELTHQLKTPLTILRGRNELGLTTRREQTELRELLEDNVADIDAVVNLLNTLLELARLDSRIDRLATAPVALRPFLEELSDEMTPLWLARNLNFSLQGEDVVVAADREALRQVFLNLYDNACKFATQGGRLTTSWAQVGAEVTIVVTNDGPSIPEAELELVFRRFFRSGTVDQDHPGSGLGLSIVRSLVHLHGGSIRAYTPAQGGAAFEMRWPVAS